ncbi:MAG TPA: DUF934 domain-containing protein [Burkholderiaceae bacterium]|nr:DUF934 domain-containing protein [Burkholderiaceae bacterium]
MATLIDRNGLRPDTWRAFDGDAAAVPPDADLLLPLDEWRERASVWGARPGRLGILLAPSDDPAAIAADLGRFALVAVGFPAFTDGRGYSSARLLRERHGWRGELRAVGDVLRDQLFLLARCGFDTFALRDDQDPRAALAAFGDFDVRYQSGVDEPVPLFRRRDAAVAA